MAPKGGRGSSISTKITIKQDSHIQDLDTHKLVIVEPKSKHSTCANGSKQTRNKKEILTNHAAELNNASNNDKYDVTERDVYKKSNPQIVDSSYSSKYYTTLLPMQSENELKVQRLKVKQVMDITDCEEDDVLIALHDAHWDQNDAVELLFNVENKINSSANCNNGLGQWKESSAMKRKKKKHIQLVSQEVTHSIRGLTISRGGGNANRGSPKSQNQNHQNDMGDTPSIDLSNRNMPTRGLTTSSRGGRGVGYRSNCRGGFGRGNTSTLPCRGVVSSSSRSNYSSAGVGGMRWNSNESTHRCLSREVDTINNNNDTGSAFSRSEVSRGSSSTPSNASKKRCGDWKASCVKHEETVANGVDSTNDWIKPITNGANSTNRDAFDNAGNWGDDFPKSDASNDASQNNQSSIMEQCKSGVGVVHSLSSPSSTMSSTYTPPHPPHPQPQPQPTISNHLPHLPSSSSSLTTPMCTLTNETKYKTSSTIPVCVGSVCLPSDISSNLSPSILDGNEKKMNKLFFPPQPPSQIDVQFSALDMEFAGRGESRSGMWNKKDGVDARVGGISGLIGSKDNETPSFLSPHIPPSPYYVRKNNPSEMSPQIPTSSLGVVEGGCSTEHGVLNHRSNVQSSRSMYQSSERRVLRSVSGFPSTPRGSGEREGSTIPTLNSQYYQSSSGSGSAGVEDMSGRDGMMINDPINVSIKEEFKTKSEGVAFTSILHCSHNQNQNLTQSIAPLSLTQSRSTAQNSSGTSHSCNGVVCNTSTMTCMKEDMSCDDVEMKNDVVSVTSEWSSKHLTISTSLSGIGGGEGCCPSLSCNSVNSNNVEMSKKIRGVGVEHLNYSNHPQTKSNIHSSSINGFSFGMGTTDAGAVGGGGGGVQIHPHILQHQMNNGVRVASEGGGGVLPPGFAYFYPPVLSGREGESISNRYGHQKINTRNISSSTTHLPHHPLPASLSTQQNQNRFGGSYENTHQTFLSTSNTSSSFTTTTSNSADFSAIEGARISSILAKSNLRVGQEKSNICSSGGRGDTSSSLAISSPSGYNGNKRNVGNMINVIDGSGGRSTHHHPIPPPSHAQPTQQSIHFGIGLRGGLSLHSSPSSATQINESIIHQTSPISSFHVPNEQKMKMSEVSSSSISCATANNNFNDEYHHNMVMNQAPHHQFWDGGVGSVITSAQTMEAGIGIGGVAPSTQQLW